MKLCGGTALVTGATGFLGQWVTRRLLAEGRHVIAMVRPGRLGTTPSSLEGLTVIESELCSVEATTGLLDAHGVEAVFHLAGDSTIHASRTDPTSTFKTNIEGTWSILEACRRTPSVGSVVIASSDKAYGESADLPYVEDAPLRGGGPYEASKACGDLLAQSYGSHFGVPVAVVRSGNFFGGGDLNWSRLVPSVLRSAISGDIIRLRSDGTPVRDYIYIEDAADAFLRVGAAVQQQSHLRGSAFNVSTRNRLSTIDLVRKLTSALGTPDAVVLGSPAGGEISQQYLDPSRFEREVGWSTSTTLQTAVQRTVNWYVDFFGPSPKDGSVQRLPGAITDIAEVRIPGLAP